MSRASTQVVIVGAGPTGMALALWLTRAGVRCRLIDKSAASAATSRAMVVQARTLELYRQVGIADDCIAAGTAIEGIRLHVEGRPVARVALGAIGEDLSPYPYALALPQDRHERILEAALRRAGVEIERGREFKSCVEDDRGIAVEIASSGGTERVLADYLVGCDGFHSAVREAMGVGMPGGTYSQRFFVADARTEGTVGGSDIVVALGPTAFFAMFPLPEAGSARLIGTLDKADSNAAELAANIVGGAKQLIGVAVRHTGWLSTYQVHHRVAESFGRGRMFLAGDAAHVHSPAGGQGLDTGVGDAINLAWKLAAVLRDGASPELLDSYETERRSFALKLVRTTDRAFEGAVSGHWIARTLRLRVMPRLWPWLLQQGAVRRMAFRTISQVGIDYRGRPLSAGRSGVVRGGDRLPWCRSPDSFRLVDRGVWQLQIFGGRDAGELSRLAAEHGIESHSLELSGEARRAGFTSAYYLVRPDGYIAATGRRPAELRAYLDGVWSGFFRERSGAAAAVKPALAAQ